LHLGTWPGESPDGPVAADARNYKRSRNDAW